MHFYTLTVLACGSLGFPARPLDPAVSLVTWAGDTGPCVLCWTKSWNQVTVSHPPARAVPAAHTELPALKVFFSIPLTRG